MFTNLIKLSILVTIDAYTGNNYWWTVIIYDGYKNKHGNNKGFVGTEWLTAAGLSSIDDKFIKKHGKDIHLTTIIIIT